ncbi:hypothetical protein B7C51_01135 [Paenibacillus larvae subsp. pulvifaciens]|uniref:Uncharacterized protein n=1 Tax=Paenibacillus larvae subsp. pulvifaciens TaxID=1477 RepID=A0A1V0UNS4_9BACL|nr:hypothetical protein [Paenibacillus larvae]ARF66710.1 hypothetical protein B7C51_01135 [Paenibacillus larvae subsp. pulvifaciens]
MTETKVCIHPVHRRLAELCMKHNNLCELNDNLSAEEIQELWQCLKRNADLVMMHNGLKRLGFLAHLINDEELKEEIKLEIKQLEASFFEETKRS